MKCKGCPFKIWHNDLYLAYCDVTLELVEDDTDCLCPERRLEEEGKNDQRRAKKLQRPEA